MSTLSTPSTENSLQRSALNISVGDTKSIVLALQALQSKIRQLEKDRDYHHEQYENAIRSHETFKTMMEAKIEQERVAHQKREQELSDLLKKALEDKTKLNSTPYGNGEALVQLKVDLETMIAAEKKYAEEREEKLLLEIQELHRIIKQEKLEHAAVLLKLEEFQRYPDAHTRSHVQPSNSVVQVEQNNSSTPVGEVQSYGKMRHGEGTKSSVTPGFTPRDGGKRVSAKPRAQSRHARRLSSSHQRHSSYHRHHASYPHRYHHQSTEHCHCCCSPRTGMAGAPPHHSSYQFSYTHTYQDPTCNSMLRDVRNVSGISPCTHTPSDPFVPGSNTVMPHASSDIACPSSFNPTPMIVISDGADALNKGIDHAELEPSASQKKQLTPLTSARRKNVPSEIVRQSYPNSHPQQESPNDQTDVEKLPLASTTPYVEGKSPREKALEDEVNVLQRQLETFVSSPALAQMSVTEMRAYFHRLSSLLERKQEQLSLLQSSSSRGRTSSASAKNIVMNDPNDVISARTRQALMNEMRAIAANALERHS